MMKDAGDEDTIVLHAVEDAVASVGKAPKPWPQVISRLARKRVAPKQRENRIEAKEVTAGRIYTKVGGSICQDQVDVAISRPAELKPHRAVS